MADIGKDIERPLGQKLQPKRRASRGISGGTLVAVLAVLAVIGVSGAIALRDKPFRKPQDVAVSTPKVVAAPATPAPAPAPAPVAAATPQASTPMKSGGPQIIHVQTEEGDSPPKAAIVIRDPSTLGQNLKVAHIPDRALIEASETGPLPIRSADGRRPFDVYARPWSGARGARVAIVIGGLAVSQTGTQAAIAKLPAEVTLAFAPQGNSIGRWMQAARQSGHEIVMQVPLEPFDYPNINPGRNTLTVSASPDENLKSLHWALSRTTNYTGVMNYMGARFSADASAMEPFMAELGKRGLAYIDDGSSSRSVAPDLALKDGVPFVAGDMAIDAVQDRGEILKKLDSLEATARAKGSAVGIGSAFD
ncbi:MAG: divergent polysaccharide deacetylase family protein, partial [Mesorhizobium sp.]